MNMLFLTIRVDVEEKLVRKLNIVHFLEYFSFFTGTRLYHIPFVFQKYHRSLQNLLNFKLKFRTCFLYLISIVYLRFFRNSFCKQSK